MSGTTIQVHATCVRLARAGAAFGAPKDAGVLLLGKSGAGKSDLALRLIANGAELVADDRTDLFVRRGRLFGRAPKRIAGLLEIRGVGILDIPYADECRISLAVELAEVVPRHPKARLFAPPASLKTPVSARPPVIRIAAYEASAPAKIAAAAGAFSNKSFRDNVKPE